MEEVEKKENVKKENVKKVENKKDVKGKNEEKKNKGKVTIETKKSKVVPIISIIVIIALVVIVVLSIIFLGNTPKKTVDEMLQALKDADYETVNNYVNYNELISSSESVEGENFDEETQKLFFDKLSWNITEVKQENDVANVTVEITNKNFKTIINNYMQRVLRIALRGENIDSQGTENYLIEELKNENVETTTNTQTITLLKQDGKWIITTSNEELMNMLLPGLNEAVNSLS